MAKRWSHIRFLRHMMKRAVIFALFGIMTAFAVAMADMNKGADKMELFGGYKGKVPFPHRMHQENLGDCTICHSIFPQDPGSIDDLKEMGSLEKQQVMKKLCIKCHKEEKMKGNKAGPTVCSKCHIR